MKLKILCAFVLSVATSPSWAHGGHEHTQLSADAGTFNIETYLEKCGGKIYSKCNDKTLNQISIYEDAKALAKSKNINVMVVIGADWCPSCKFFNELLKKDQDTNKLEQIVVPVEINGDLSSAKDLAKQLGISYFGYPQAFIISPAKSEGESDQMIQHFYPTGFESVAALIKNLDPVVTTSTYTPSITTLTAIGPSSMTLLKSRIEYSEGYGISNFITDPKTEDERLINMGFAAFNVFHWADAFRAFYTSSQISNSVYAQVGMALAAMSLDSYSGILVANASLENIKALASTRELNLKEQAWRKFIQAYVVFNAYNYKRQAGEEVVSLSEAVANLLKHDSSNIEVKALISWLDSGLSSTVKIAHFNEALKKNPDHAGAHHYLLHTYEALNKEKEAVKHAQILSKLAPKSAHAQHMFGHVLPQMGKWREALKHFENAHSIHLAWAKNNNVKPEEDWHYSHNLDLMAATYLGLGQVQKAKEIWFEASPLDTRALVNFIGLFLATMPSQKSIELIDSYTKDSTAWKDYLKDQIEEANLSGSSLRATYEDLIQRTSETQEDSYAALKRDLLGAKLNKGIDSASLNSRFETYFSNKVGAGGFDGWSTGYIEILRLKRLAQMLGLSGLLKSINNVESKVRGGVTDGGHKLCGLDICKH